MNTLASSIARRPLSDQLRSYFLEARCEFLRVLRTPGFALPTLLFPVMFYLFFGVLFARGQNGMQQSLYSLAGLGVFGVIGPGLFGFGVGFALDRGLGWLQVKRASPMPPSAYLLAKLCMSMLFALIIVVLLFTLAAGLSHVRLERSQWLLLALTLVFGTVPFCAMGLAIGAWSKPQASPAIVNLVLLPMSFLSGLWVPLQFFPAVMEKIAALLPAYHLGQLAFAAVGFKQGVPVLSHVIALTAFTLGFLALAARGYRLNPASNG
jgi:ABC-2 type transport system permease protein